MVNVLDFKRRGVTDDEAFAQATQAAGEHGELVIPDGEYILTTEWLLDGKTGLVVRGEGRPRILSEAECGLRLHNSERVRISNLLLQSKQGSNPRIVPRFGIRLTGSHHCLLEHVLVLDFAQHCLVTGPLANEIPARGREAYVTAHHSHGLRTLNCRFDAGDNYGVHAPAAVYHGEASNNTLHVGAKFCRASVSLEVLHGRADPFPAGIPCAVHLAGGASHEFISCDFGATNTVGLRVANWGVLSLSGCHFEGNGRALSLETTGSLAVTLSACYFNLPKEGVAVEYPDFGLVPAGTLALQRLRVGGCHFLGTKSDQHAFRVPPQPFMNLDSSNILHTCTL